MLLGLAWSISVPPITQAGDSALVRAVSEGRIEVVSLMVKAGAPLDLQNEVVYSELAKQMKRTFSCCSPGFHLNT